MSWVFLVYRLPREPSTPRIALWRKLRRLGALQLVDGVVALPLTDRNREQLEWSAQEVTDAGGDASVWLAEPTLRSQAQALERSARAASAAEYERIRRDADAAVSAAARKRLLHTLRRALHDAASREFFAVPERSAAERAVEQLAESVEASRT
jgi:hypothetical protein